MKDISGIARQYYLETFISSWIQIFFTIIVGAVLVHINLSYVIGSCIIFVGLGLALVTMVGAVCWLVLGGQKQTFAQEQQYLRIRNTLLIFKYILVMGVAGLFTWAAVLMIQKSLGL